MASPPTTVVTKLRDMSPLMTDFFVALAQGLGVEASRAETAEAFEAQFEAAMRQSGAAADRGGAVEPDGAEPLPEAWVFTV